MSEAGALAQPRRVGFPAWLRSMLPKPAAATWPAQAAHAGDQPPVLRALEVASLCHGGGG